MNKGNSNISYISNKAESIGSDYVINCNAIIHSNDGEFTKETKRHISGGHGQTSIDYMNQNNIKYEINIVYNNGVRVGNIIDSKIDSSEQATFILGFPNAGVQLTLGMPVHT